MKYLTKLFFAVFLIQIFGCNSQDFVYKPIPKNIIAPYYKSRDSLYKKIEAANFYGAYDLTKSLPKGYDKTGKTDYTNFLQKGINNSKNIVFPDFPVLINKKGLDLKSNTNVYFKKNSQLVLKPTDTTNYEMLRMHQVENVNLYFPNLKGDYDKHLGTKGECGHGIEFKKAENCSVYYAYLTNMWGDGMAVDDYTLDWVNFTTTKNLKIISPYIDAVRRNGISVLSVEGLYIKNLYVSNSYGTNPQSAIVIEPNGNYNTIRNIKIDNIISYNNYVSALIVSLHAYYGKNPRQVEIEVNNPVDYGGMRGNLLILSPDKDKKDYKPITGHVKINNTKLYNNWNKTIHVEEGNRNTVKVYIKNPYTNNPKLNNITKEFSNDKNVYLVK